MDFGVESYEMRAATSVAKYKHLSTNIGVANGVRRRECALKGISSAGKHAPAAPE